MIPKRGRFVRLYFGQIFTDKTYLSFFIFGSKRALSISPLKLFSFTITAEQINPSKVESRSKPGFKSIRLSITNKKRKKWLKGIVERCPTCSGTAPGKSYSQCKVALKLLSAVLRKFLTHLCLVPSVDQSQRGMRQFSCFCRRLAVSKRWNSYYPICANLRIH